MEKRFGAEKSTALEKYTVNTLMTRESATEIVETLWKGATPTEKVKAIMLCATYNLNPLMNHIFLLPFKTVGGGTNWAVAIGIEATRLMARRRHKYTYLDLTPRRATEDELNKILGEQRETGALYFITKIKDLETSAEAYGLGFWKGTVYGSDKGNSAANMAAIRSERQALKRLYPAEMPTGVDVVDENFVQAAGNGAVEGECRVVDEDAGEIIEEPAPEPAKPAASQTNPDLITPAQRQKLFATSRGMGLPDEDLKSIISRKYGCDSSTKLTKAQASELIEKIEQGFILNPETGEWTK